MNTACAVATAPLGMWIASPGQVVTVGHEAVRADPLDGPRLDLAGAMNTDTHELTVWVEVARCQHLRFAAGAGADRESFDISGSRTSRVRGRP